MNITLKHVTYKIPKTEENESQQNHADLLSLLGSPVNKDI